jgi:hypothetical protein
MQLYSSQLFYLKLFDAKLFVSQDFIKVNTKGIQIYFIVISECVVVTKDLEWRSDKTKVVDLKKLCNIAVDNFFI